MSRLFGHLGVDEINSQLILFDSKIIQIHPTYVFRLFTACVGAYACWTPILETKNEKNSTYSVDGFTGKHQKEGAISNLKTGHRLGERFMYHWTKT